MATEAEATKTDPPPIANNTSGEGGEGAAKKKKKKRNRKKKKTGANSTESGDETGPPTPTGAGTGTNPDDAQANGDGIEVTAAAGEAKKNGGANNNNNKNKNKKNNQNKNNPTTSLPADLEKIKKLEEEVKALQEEKKSAAVAGATGTASLAADLETIQKLEADLKKAQEEKASLKDATQILEANLVDAEKAKNKEIIALKDEIESLKSQIGSLEKEKQATETALSQMKSMEQLPPNLEALRGEKEQLDSKVKGLQSELDSVKEGFVADRAQLEQNLQMAHDVQMAEAKKKQKSIEQELLHTQQELKLSLQRMQELAAASQENTSRSAPAAGGGEDVAKVWQDKCVAKAKELKETQKLLKGLEADKKDLEAQLDKVVVDKKPWWMCG